MNTHLTRRDAIVAAAALTACGRQTRITRKFPVSKVSVVKAPAYSMDVYDTVFRLVREHQPDIRGKRVVLKPNLVEYDSNTVINTHPMVVHATFEAFKKLGAAE